MNTTSDDLFKFNTASHSKAKVEEAANDNSIGVRDSDDVSILSGLRFQGIDKEDYDEEQDVFVDV